MIKYNTFQAMTFTLLLSFKSETGLPQLPSQHIVFRNSFGLVDVFQTCSQIHQLLNTETRSDFFACLEALVYPHEVQKRGPHLLHLHVVDIPQLANHHLTLLQRWWLPHVGRKHIHQEGVGRSCRDFYFPYFCLSRE